MVFTTMITGIDATDGHFNSITPPRNRKHKIYALPLHSGVTRQLSPYQDIVVLFVSLSLFLSPLVAVPLFVSSSLHYNHVKRII
jgi:hypothetical protein